jgi:hypothetical protein
VARLLLKVRFGSENPIFLRSEPGRCVAIARARCMIEMDMLACQSPAEGEEQATHGNARRKTVRRSSAALSA